jgi:hypothetical protein
MKGRSCVVSTLAIFRETTFSGSSLNQSICSHFFCLQRRFGENPGFSVSSVGKNCTFPNMRLQPGLPGVFVF